MNETWALVPLKRLDRAKRRLAPALTPESRADLVLAMFTDVLEALAGVRSIARILLVSNEPEAGSLFHPANVEVFYSAPSEGMNRELEQAAAYAWSQGAQQVLIVHGDLPYLTARAIGKFLTTAPPDGMRAAACKLGSGTNVLLLPLPLRIPLVFGRHSLQRFQRLAEGVGQHFDIVRDLRLAADIDDQADFARLSTTAHDGPRPGSATQAFLDEFAHRRSTAVR